MKSSTYFHIKSKIWADFQMCINVRLNSAIAERCYKQGSFISQMESVPLRRYDTIAVRNRSAHLFTVAISSRSYIKRKQPEEFFFNIAAL